MYKKGQVEDFFADLIPAVVVVVIALLVISLAGVLHRNKVEATFESDLARLSSSDLNVLMRSPADIDALKAHGYDIEVADAIVLFSDAVKDREKYSWLWEEKVLKGEDTVSCDDELYAFLDDYFSGYYSWNILTPEIRCWRLGSRTTTPYSSVPQEIHDSAMDAVVLIPGNDPSSPVRVSFKGWFEVEE
ncbi:MAG: hypothetical protein ABIB71_07160 [Candidatus Woesearchaeota archaeon]